MLLKQIFLPWILYSFLAINHTCLTWKIWLDHFCLAFKVVTLDLLTINSASIRGGRGLDQMSSRSLFQPRCCVVVIRQIEEKENQGPWPESLPLINLLCFQASSLCPQINLPWLPAGTEDLLTSSCSPGCEWEMGSSDWQRPWHGQRAAEPEA